METGRYVWKRCHNAVEALILDWGELGDRLNYSWISLSQLRARDFHRRGLRMKFKAIAARLSDRDGRATLTLDELRRIARKIMKLYDGVCAYYSADPDATLKNRFKTGRKKGRRSLTTMPR